MSNKVFPFVGLLLNCRTQSELMYWVDFKDVDLIKDFLLRYVTWSC